MKQTVVLTLTALLLAPLVAPQAANTPGEANVIQKSIFDIRDFGASGDAAPARPSRPRSAASRLLPREPGYSAVI